MKRLALLFVAPSLLAGLTAQSNTVPGLDGRLTNIANPTFYGRRGPAYPNGEVGMAFANTMCNPGSVNIPWYQAMQPNHPKFGFLIVRVANDKIEQINEWSFCKHAFVSVNVNGACGTCQQPGTGSLMGLNCSDTYGAGNNASRTWLGPPHEIDPWLGTWNPVGSYFDIGDPSQPGYPAPADGVRSLSQSIFDSVDNRVTIDEIDLTTPNADYYYGLQLIHEGEALANRGDNLAHRPLNVNWTGSSWNFSSGSGQDAGTILQRWPGATIHSASNGNDDGRFFVASKVTSLGGGNYHYEYAIHNVDNSRAGASFRVPIDATATASNYSFGDIDTDPANDWSVSRIGNEIVFQAGATNPLEWNTIYNFSFDADFPPGNSTAHIDEARPGPGANEVSIQTEVPGGTTIATFSKFGNGCPVSQMIPVPQCNQLNELGGVLTGTTSANQYVYRVGGVAGTWVTSFDLFCRSTTGGSVTVPAYIYGLNGNSPSTNPIATGSMTVGPAGGFYTATFPSPVQTNGIYYIGIDSTAQNIVISDLSSGSFNLGYWRTNVGGPWTLQVMKPSWTVQCTTQPLYPTPDLDIDALPLLGTTYNVTLAEGVASSIAVLVSGTSSTGPSGVPIPGAPGCDLFASPDVLQATPISPTGTASLPISIPNSGALIGFNAYHQWGVLDIPANSLGVVVSDAGHATVGQ